MSAMCSGISVPPAGLHSVPEQEDLGKRARKIVPRSAARECTIGDRDPVELLRRQDLSRVPELLPVRYARMSVSPFRFYRGTAGLMAHDLAGQPQTGVRVVLSGDAHIGNFGFYASPERNLIFDLNDFDEAAPGPWEWDVKRLAASVMVASRERGGSREYAEGQTRQTVGAYRRALRRFVEMPMLDRYYLSVRDDMLGDNLSGQSLEELRRVTRKARRRTSEQAVRKLMTTGPDGWRRFREDPPVLQHPLAGVRDAVGELVTQYLHSVRPDVALLVANCRVADIARRVVGVGSVGTRCYLAALEGPDSVPVVLQIKEAQESVVAAAQRDLTRGSRDGWREAARMSSRAVLRDTTQGRRVVTCQQVLQSVSDPFLGWLTFAGHDYYVRQFRDMKGGFDVDELEHGLLSRYAAACATLLARAHAQSPACYWIAGYLGESSVFDRAVAAWAGEYADQSRSDYDALLQAVHDGRVPVSD